MRHTSLNRSNFSCLKAGVCLKLILKRPVSIFAPLEQVFGRGRIKSFTLVEILIVVLTLGVLMAGFFYALITGESSWSFNAAKIEVQSEVRRAVDWIAKDVRQSWDIGRSNNNPSSTHIKFKKVIGYNTAGGGSVALSNNFTEYTYDSGLKTITRTELSPDGSCVQNPDGSCRVWTFRNIIQAPFYTNNNGSIIVIDPSSPGENSPIFFQTKKNLVIILTGQKPVKSGLNATYTLTEEVKIRIE